MKRRLSRTILLASGYFCLLLSKGQLLAQRVELERDKKLIVLIEAKNQEDSSEGFASGIVVGRHRNELYIVTANHAVRKNIVEVKVTFPERPQSVYTGTILNRDANLDVAVLAVKGSSQQALPDEDFPLEILSRSSEIRLNDKVWSIGNNQRKLDTTPRDSKDQIEAIEETIFKFKSIYVQPGYSGGGVFDVIGGQVRLVGMLIKDQPPLSIALNFTRILKWLADVQIDVTPVSVSRRMPDRGGLELKVLSGPSDQDAPYIWELDQWPGNRFQFLTECPSGTSGVFYSFGNHEYLAASPIGAGKDLVFEAFPTSDHLRLIFKMGDGQTSGPFEYMIPDREATIARNLRATFSSNLQNALKCKYIPYNFPEEANSPETPTPEGGWKSEAERATAFSEQRRHTGEAEARKIQIWVVLEREGLTFAKRGPCVACVPPSGAGGSFVPWAGVKEVKIGNRTGDLNVTVPVTVDWEKFLSSGEEYFPLTMYSYSVWCATLPPETTEVFAKFMYRDGTESAEFRFPVSKPSFPQL